MVWSSPCSGGVTQSRTASSGALNVPEEGDRNLSRQPAPVFDHPHRKRGFPHTQTEFLAFRLVPIASCPFTDIMTDKVLFLLTACQQISLTLLRAGARLHTRPLYPAFLLHRRRLSPLSPQPRSPTGRHPGQRQPGGGGPTAKGEEEAERPGAAGGGFPRRGSAVHLGAAPSTDVQHRDGVPRAGRPGAWRES